MKKQKLNANLAYTIYNCRNDMVSLKNPKKYKIGDTMATTFDKIVDELNMDERKELIRELFHNVDGASDYFWYEFAPQKAPKILEDNNIRRNTPSETYLYNLCERIWRLGQEFERAEEVEVFDNFDVSNNVLTFGVLTMTAVSDPKVNYYDDGSDSVEAFIEELKDIIQIDDITYVEDWDFDEMSGRPSQSGDIIIRLGSK